MYRFVFSMQHEDDSVVVYYIPLALSDKAAAAARDNILDGSSDIYNDYVSDLESEYGVHDFVTEGDYELIGYCSYEIDPDKEQELMRKWRDVLIQLELNPQEIFKTTEDKYREMFEDEHLDSI